MLFITLSLVAWGSLSRPSNTLTLGIKLCQLSNTNWGGTIHLSSGNDDIVFTHKNCETSQCYDRKLKRKHFKLYLETFMGLE